MNKQQRLVVIVSILASFVAFLDGSVVNVALPAITSDFNGSLAVQQWVVDAYLLSLGSLILIAGSMSDLFGRKRIMTFGLIAFGVTSLLCAIAPSSEFLIVARLLQGAAGALLVPSSLALITSSFSGPLEGKAIGTWTAWTSISFIIGPLVGGALVDLVSWRLIFAINVVPIAITLWLMTKLKKRDTVIPNAKVDYIGAILCIIGLGGPVYALIEQPRLGFGSAQVLAPLLVGIISIIAFIAYERRISHPMLPLSLFKQRNFLVGNIATIFIYSSLTIATFLISVFVQQVGKYSAFAAGMALIPPTFIMFFLAPKFGALAGKYGPRLFMSIGPVVAGLGFLTMLSVDQSVTYWQQLFPGILLFGMGLAITVAPLTAAVLGAVDPSKSGIASAVNNAVTRIAGLVAIAMIGVVIGDNLNVDGFHRGVTVMAVLIIFGGVVSAIGIENKKPKNPTI